MKLFAFFLPQFHEIPENNEWWGEGFTEWTNVKKAEPLYKGHIQPKHPLNDNYYNLLDKKTVEWQTNLMHEYHVDGLIYYHYYFTGKKLLEKPAENLLQWPDIHQPFFFCWANHSWNRSWNGTKEVLLAQNYGDVADWEEHFDYLLPFFQDSRYEKIDNKPLFMVFISEFKEKLEMFDFFDKKCKENGFNGIYIIETFDKGKNWPRDFKLFKESVSHQTERFFLREPLVSENVFQTLIKYYPERAIRKTKKIVKKALKIGYVDTLNGDLLLDVIQKNEIYDGSVIHGTFFEWDNTPRHGYRGSVITPPSKDNFMRTMNTFRDDDYLFINAWNEWAEGMILEPTEENRYKYLEWVKEWVENNS